MTITKKLIPILFITTFIILTITNSQQLCAMEPETVKTSDETTMDKDFQAYKLLSLIDNDHQCYLLPELVQIIATNMSKLIDKDCYEEYGVCLKDTTSLLNFIKDRCDKSISHISTETIIKHCLRHSCKSLNEIKDDWDLTVFHLIHKLEGSDNSRMLYWIKTFKLIAGSEAWNIICMKSIDDYTALHTCTNQSTKDSSIIKELLLAAPNAQAAWNLILATNGRGDTALDSAKKKKNITQLFESYRPKEQ